MPDIIYKSMDLTGERFSFNFFDQGHMVMTFIGFVGS